MHNEYSSKNYKYFGHQLVSSGFQFQARLEASYPQPKYIY